MVKDEQKQSSNIVEALAVPHIRHVRSKSTQCHGEGPLALPALEEGMLWKGAGNIQVDLLQVPLVRLSLIHI